MKSQKSPVQIREKELKSGARSLYLDIYTGNGKRKYVFLKLYLQPGKSAAAKHANAEVMNLAEIERAKYLRQLIEGAGIINPAKPQMRFADFADQCVEERKRAGGLARALTFEVTADLFKKFAGEDVRLGAIDEDLLRGFIGYLLNKKARRPEAAKTIAKGTARTYFAALATMLRTAHTRGLITRNPINQLSLSDTKDLRGAKARRAVYLTAEEVQAMEATKCRNEHLKRAFLFACFTGLRLSDVKQLHWSNIVERENGRFVSVTMQKTREQIEVPLSEAAATYLPPREQEGALFQLSSDSATGITMRNWAKRAGIKKHVSFHVSRHTFATLGLAAGVPVTTIARLLGHKSVSTTMIYADVLAEDMIEATAKIGGMAQ